MKSAIKNDIALAILRIAPSVMLFTHGVPKLQKILSGNFEFADPLGMGPAPSIILAVIAEILCPILIILGIKTRWAAIPPIILMTVIAFVHHSTDEFPTKEKAFLFLTFFIVIVLLGPGKYSLDKK